MRKKIIILTVIIICISAGIWLWQKSVFIKQGNANQISNLQTFQKEKWYSDFINEVKQMNRANEYDRKCFQYFQDGRRLTRPLEVDCAEGKITEGDIASVLYFKDDKIVIAVVPAIYGGSGFKLLKYSIKNKNLEIANREDIQGGKNTRWYKWYEAALPDSVQKEDIYPWFGPPDKIVSYRNGTVVLTGLTGDAGCGTSSTFIYDIKANYINITKRCDSCEEEAEECINF